MEQALQEINEDLMKEVGYKKKHKHNWEFIEYNKDKQGKFKKYRCNCGSWKKVYFKSTQKSEEVSKK